MSDEADDLREIAEYNPETGTYRVSYEGAAESISVCIIEAVSGVSGTDMTELEPLRAVVDPDALDRLFGPTTRGPDAGDAHITFEYATYTITVHSYGIIKIHPPDETRRGFPNDSTGTDR